MRFIFFLFILLSTSCQDTESAKSEVVQMSKKGIQLIVLGTVQDGGAPHIGCTKSCCARLWKEPDESLKVVSLGIIDFDNNKT